MINLYYHHDDRTHLGLTLVVRKIMQCEVCSYRFLIACHFSRYVLFVFFSRSLYIDRSLWFKFIDYKIFIKQHHLRKIIWYWHLKCSLLICSSNGRFKNTLYGIEKTITWDERNYAWNFKNQCALCISN